jgi:hypothetical protein
MDGSNHRREENENKMRIRKENEKAEQSKRDEEDQKRKAKEKENEDINAETRENRGKQVAQRKEVRIAKNHRKTKCHKTKKTKWQKHIKKVR